MDKQMRNELNKAIKDYNLTQGDLENRVNMQDILNEVGSLDNEEVEKAVELLRSKTENKQ